MSLWFQALVACAALTGMATAEPREFSAVIHSSLSPDGGMHRLLRHTITISRPKVHEDAALINATLISIIDVPSDVFVDMEDLIESGLTFGPCHYSCDVRPLDERMIIDIEKPAFESPHHQVELVMSIGSMDSNEGCIELDDDDDLLIQFTVKIHLRYPTPLSPKIATESRYVDASILPTSIVKGEMNYKSWGPELNGEGVFNFRLQGPEANREDDSPQSVLIAAGVTSHYGWVSSLTVGFAMIGMILLLREIDRASEWD